MMKMKKTAVLVFVLIVCTLSLAEPRSKHFTTSDGVRLHYLEAGQGDLLVLVPGWTMPAWIWEPQIKHFSKTHRVVALDPRSQGESEKPAEGHTPARRARDIKELLDHVGGGPAVLAGWSLGVPELIKYVDLFGTEGVRALVLVDGTIPDPENPTPPDMTRGMFGWLLGMQNDRAKFTEGFVRSMYKKPQREEYLRRVTEASLKTPTNSAVVLLANMMTYGDWRPMVKKIDVPVLYVYQPQLQSSAERLKKAMPSVRLELFEEAGHALFVDEAERFNRVVEEFVARTNSRAADRQRLPTVYRTDQVKVLPKPILTSDPKVSGYSGPPGRGRKFRGTVVVAIIVDEEGLVRAARIVKGVGQGIDERVLEAVKQWQFEPGIKDGQPVAVQMNVELNLTLDPN